MVGEIDTQSDTLHYTLMNLSGWSKTNTTKYYPMRLSLILSFLHASLRFQLRNKGYLLINTFGLTLGFLVVTLIGIYLVDEYSFDNFHAKRDRIYRLWDTMSIDNESKIAITPFVWGTRLKESFPEVQEVVSFNTRPFAVKYGEEINSESKVLIADTTFFKIFDFPVLRGSKSSLLTDLGEVVITTETASRYFGDEDAIGKSLAIKLYGELVNFTVSGVVECPGNSHIQFDFIIPRPVITARNPFIKTFMKWDLHSMYTYILLAEGASAEGLASKLDGYLRQNMGEQASNFNPSLQAFSDIYLYSQLEAELSPKGNISNVRLLAGVAFIILLIVVTNSVNLNVAQALNRIRELNVRKVFGSKTKEVIIQLTLQSVFLAITSFLVAVVIIITWLPEFSALLGKDLPQILSTHLFTLGMAMLALTLLIGLLTGGYPALVVTRFSTIAVLRTKTSLGKQSSALRKWLVVFQFTLAFTLLIAASVSYTQFQFLRSKDLGFSNNGVVIIKDGRNVSVDPIKIKLLEDALKGSADFISVTSASSYPGQEGHWGSVYIPEGFDKESPITASTIHSHFDFIETYSLQITQGRDFDKLIQGDIDEGFIINESALSLFAATEQSWLTDPIGKSLEWQFGADYKKGKVIGVIEDFHFQPLYNAISPLVIQIDPKYAQELHVKLQTKDLSSTLGFLEKEWVKLFPEIPFDYKFADDTFQESYHADLRLANLIGLFALGTVMLALIGMIGLVSYVSAEKTREVGIRKVLGAELSSILVLQSKYFMRMLLIGMIMAIPLAFFISDNWLSNFAYRVGTPVGVYLLSLAILFIPTMVCVILQTYHAASLNPTKALRED